MNSIITIARGGEEEETPRYPDTGCELAPRCLECPLPRCRFDTVDGKQWRRRPKGIPNRRGKGGQGREAARRLEKGGSGPFLGQEKGEEIG